MNNSTLTALFEAVGRRHGYERITAEFAAFRDFKIKWTRSPRWISFEVSDYLSDAPEGVVTSLASTIFTRIRGEGDAPYPDDVCEWITSDDFVRSKQPLYVRRYRGLSRSTAGSEVDLSDAYERLIGRGLVERDPDLYMGWSPAARSARAGRASVLMKVVAMSDVLDDRDMPEEVIDYCLYAQIAHVCLGFNPCTGGRGVEYGELLSRFPDRAGVELELTRRNLLLRGDPKKGVPRALTRPVTVGR